MIDHGSDDWGGGRSDQKHRDACVDTSDESLVPVTGTGISLHRLCQTNHACGALDRPKAGASYTPIRTKSDMRFATITTENRGSRRDICS
jgi:hypothetical protein